MQRHINERWQASMVDFGNGWQYATCSDAIAAEINHACYELRRARLIRACRPKSMPFSGRHHEYLRLWRIAWQPRRLRLRIGSRA
jgi:hypothetical protein